MYLFTRSARLAAGKTRESAAWAVAVTEKVNQIAPFAVRLWTPVFSPGLGTLVWAATVDSLAELEAADAKLIVDDGYVDLVDQGAAFASGDAANDELVSIIHGEIDPSREVAYVAVVHATMAPGKLGRGIELAVEIAQRAQQTTGFQTIVGADSTGAYGAVRWISGYESVGQLEQAEGAIGADASFTAFIDQEAAGVYLPGVTTQTILRRIA